MLRTQIATRRLQRSRYSRKVDKLAELLAQIDTLEEKANEIKQELIDGKRAEYFGSLHKAVVSRFEQGRLDTEIVKSMLTPAEIVKATKTTPCTQVRVYSL